MEDITIKGKKWINKGVTPGYGSEEVPYVATCVWENCSDQVEWVALTDDGDWIGLCSIHYAEEGEERLDAPKPCRLESDGQLFCNKWADSADPYQRGLCAAHLNWLLDPNNRTATGLASPQKCRQPGCNQWADVCDPDSKCRSCSWKQ